MNWTALLAEIYHLRSQQLFLGEKDWRESEEGRERGRLRVRERVRARSREREGEGERGRESTSSARLDVPGEGAGENV